MEKCDGDLNDLVLNNEPVAVPQLVEICRDIIQGVAALHRAQLVHRDIKVPLSYPLILPSSIN